MVGAPGACSLRAQVSSLTHYSRDQLTVCRLREVCWSHPTSPHHQVWGTGGFVLLSRWVCHPPTHLPPDTTRCQAPPGAGGQPPFPSQAGHSRLEEAPHSSNSGARAACSWLLRGVLYCSQCSTTSSRRRACSAGSLCRCLASSPGSCLARPCPQWLRRCCSSSSGCRACASSRIWGLFYTREDQLTFEVSLWYQVVTYFDVQA